MRIPPYTALLLLLLTSLAGGLRAQTDPAARREPPPGLARSARLLTTGTPRAPQRITILVYGQSISQQEWWKELRDSLERKYPSTRITMLNRAIGGFSSERLKLTVRNDVVPLHPDLILFHDYGNEPDYEAIIRELRSETTADVAVQTDHYSPHQDNAWHDRHNEEWLPALARRYGLAVLDVRGAWKAYLRATGLDPDSLLRDQVHLNDRGNHLMASILARSLDFSPPPLVADSTVREYRPGGELRVRSGRALLRFTGNRVDLLWDTLSARGQDLQVRIDGKPPTDFAGCWYYTRPGENLGGRYWPPRMDMPIGLTLTGHPREEEWTLRVTGTDSLERRIEFALSGSLTGTDGSGTSTAPFRSPSGTVEIRPEQWFTRRGPGDFSFLPTIRPGEEIRWSVRSMCRDGVRARGEAPVTVANGLPNAVHELEIVSVAGDRIPLHAVRVYRPPLRP